MFLLNINNGIFSMVHDHMSYSLTCQTINGEMMIVFVSSLVPKVTYVIDPEFPDSSLLKNKELVKEVVRLKGVKSVLTKFILLNDLLEKEDGICLQIDVNIAAVTEDENEKKLLKQLAVDFKDIVDYLNVPVIYCKSKILTVPKEEKMEEKEKEVAE